MQRAPLVASLVGAVMVIVSVWGTAHTALRVGAAHLGFALFVRCVSSGISSTRGGC